MGEGPHKPLWWVLTLTIPVILYVVRRLTINKGVNSLLPSNKVSFFIIVIGLVSLIIIFWIGYQTYIQVVLNRCKSYMTQDDRKVVKLIDRTVKYGDPGGIRTPDLLDENQVS